MKTLPSILVGALAALAANAEDTATDLAARLNALQQDGAAFIRLKMEIQQPPGSTQTTLQIQIKQRRTATATEVVYQVLWPKQRAGEAVLLRRTAQQPASGALFLPPDTLRTLDAGQMQGSLFGSALTYADVLENFFTWQHQAIIGTATVDRTSCQILESKPGKGDRSIYAAVRTWVDTRRYVPLRVEKYLASGLLARRIDTTRVVTTNHRPTPANLTVFDPQTNSATVLDGSNIKRAVTYDDREFTAAGLQQTTPPRTKAD